ncbi:MAG TPA: hypothetical protein PLG79_06985 [Spirochaetales bacterium]|nr:hypothetical protein [Spirochaetales bacterium]HOV38448.1 hypothetical protein [Spirochaetales bacterium]
MQKLLFSLSIITVGLSLGYIIQLLVKSGRIKGDPSLTKPRRILQGIALLCLNPLAALGAIWIFELSNIRIALLPALGVLTLLTGGTAALLIGKALKLGRPQAGAFFTAGGMSNIGSIGALVVFIFLGEAGFALVPLFRLFEEFTYYAFGFPIAKSFSPRFARQKDGSHFKRLLADPFIIMTVVSIILGFILNLSGVPRPSFFTPLNGIIIPASSLLLLISIGMAMRFSSISAYFREACFVAGIKYLIVPAVVITTAYLAGLGNFDNGLPLKVVLILSSMPVGFIAMVPPSIYELDVDLSNAAWLLTTALLALIIPLQMYLINWI